MALDQGAEVPSLLEKVPGSFRSDRFFVAGCSLLSAVLSAAYIAFYLRGGPRIIDATSYYLEARALAEGHLSFHLDEPVASTLGRFLVRTDGPDGAHAAVLFPPGYPALLALGFLVGHPLVIGPVLAAAITYSTWRLARAIVPDEPSSFVSVARLATIFSVFCAALRYHTADTMSHGLSALCFSTALVFALGLQRAIHQGHRVLPSSLGMGFFTGWLVATRPVSGLALVVTLAFVLAPMLRTHIRPLLRSLSVAAFASLPGILLLLAHQYAATGQLFASSQTAYYAVADGPPGCFRYGFGAGIGCVGEHGEFVERNLPHGYGAYAATATTLRRLKQHLLDAGNTEPFFLVVLYGSFLAWRTPERRWIPLGILAQILAYVPFYFDGNYPGGGARFYADVLPLEHLLLAFAALKIAQFTAHEHAQRHRALVLLSLVPLGFLLRGRFEHEALRDREGGHPMFEAKNLPPIQGPALLYINTDHGFNLAFDPDVQSRLTSNQWSVVRERGDALDVFAWEARGKIPTYFYEYPLWTKESVGRVVASPLKDGQGDFIDPANLWPLLEQRGGHAQLSWGEGYCKRDPGTREVVLVPERQDKPASMTFALPAPYLQGRRIAPIVDLHGHGVMVIEWLVDQQVALSVRTSFGDEQIPGVRPPCMTLGKFVVPHAAQTLVFRVLREPSTDAVVALHRFSLHESE